MPVSEEPRSGYDQVTATIGQKLPLVQKLFSYFDTTRSLAGSTLPRIQKTTHLDDETNVKAGRTGQWWCMVLQYLQLGSRSFSDTLPSSWSEKKRFSPFFYGKSSHQALTCEHTINPV